MCVDYSVVCIMRSEFSVFQGVEGGGHGYLMEEVGRSDSRITRVFLSSMKSL